MVYSSINNEKIKQIKKLNTKKYRDIENVFLVEGIHLVEEAYKNSRLITLIKEENESFNLDIDTMIVTEEVIKYITELDCPSKIIGICKKTDNLDITGDKILMLDDIQDPGNLGAIIRSAAAFNIDTIVLSSHTVDLYNSKVIRASQGMIFNINIVRKDIDLEIDILKNKGYKILGTKVNGGNSLKNIEKLKKFVIIMGNEGNGVNLNTLNKCDDYLYINISNKCESLNVAIAASIILYELDK